VQLLLCTIPERLCDKIKSKRGCLSQKREGVATKLKEKGHEISVGWKMGVTLQRQQENARHFLTAEKKES